MSWLDEALLRAVERARPGRVLASLARRSVPIVAAERYALRTPEPGVAAESTSPLVEHIPPRATATGPLDGDVIIKDQVDVAGLRTGIGMADGGEIAERDAPIVARIVAAGGRVLGKAKMTELGIDGIGTLMHYPMPTNPRAPGYVPGGSSTGTAVAVASGLARYGVGGDGLGSIRIPAAFCGLYGLRPGRERMPRAGIRTPVRTLDAVGPITRTAADCARLWQVMAGEPLVALEPLVPARVGVPITGTRLRVARSVWLAFRRVLATLATEVVPVTLPGLDHVTFLGGMTGAYELATGPYADRLRTAAGRRSLAIGRAFTQASFARLHDQRARLAAATAQVLDDVPILAMPTTAIPPPALSRALLAGQSGVMLLRALGAFTPLANLLDLPAIAVPCGVDAHGRPLSVMFVARAGDETTLLRIAHAVERTGLATAPV